MLAILVVQRWLGFGSCLSSGNMLYGYVRIDCFSLKSSKGSILVARVARVARDLAAD